MPSILGICPGLTGRVTLSPSPSTDSSTAGDLVSAGNLCFIVVAAFLMTAGGTPVVRRLGLRFGLLDQPGARKLHARPVPLLGGVAILGSVLAALLLSPTRPEVLQASSILLGATWVSLWGVLDDCSGLRVGTKLSVQLVAAVLLILSGIQVHLPVPVWLNLALTLLWVIGITNASNLLDNTDGLCAGVSTVAASFFLILAILNGDLLVAVLAAALAGACLGFLIYNFNPARIFMGDSGSLFIGYLLAVLGILVRFPDNVSTVTWMVPILVLGVPIFDTTLVFFSRLRRGLNPLTTPGTDHLSHRLLRRGWSQRQTVICLYLLGCGGGRARRSCQRGVRPARVRYRDGCGPCGHRRPRVDGTPDGRTLTSP